MPSQIPRKALFIVRGHANEQGGKDADHPCVDEIRDERERRSAESRLDVSGYFSAASTSHIAWPVFRKLLFVFIPRQEVAVQEALESMARHLSKKASSSLDLSKNPSAPYSVHLARISCVG
jgi:hypothetical protein